MLLSLIQFVSPQHFSCC